MPPPPATSSGKSGGKSGASSPGSSSSSSSSSSGGSSSSRSSGGQSGGASAPDIPTLPGSGPQGSGASQGSSGASAGSQGTKDGSGTKGSADGTTKDSGTPGESSAGKASREKAGADLASAGERLSKSGAGLGDTGQARQAGANSGSGDSAGKDDGDSATGAGSNVSGVSNKDSDGHVVPGETGAGQNEIDPLMPKIDTDSETGEVVFRDTGARNASDSDSFLKESGSASGARSDSSGNQVGAPNNTSTEAGNGGIQISSGLEDKIRAAQATLEAAGGALQSAGDAVANAQTDEELAAAEELLSKARVAVIVAGRDIGNLEDQSGQATPGNGVDKSVLDQTSAALDEANVLLVIATRSVLDARTGNPNFPDGVPVEGIPSNGAAVDALEDELNDSLVVFDGKVSAARDSVLTTAPPPDTASTVSIGRPDGQSTGQDKDEQQTGDPTGEMANEQPEQVAVGGSPPAAIPDDIPSPQGDDIVAEQLREAATAEKDPALQAKLWEEYKRYKAGL